MSLVRFDLTLDEKADNSEDPLSAFTTRYGFSRDLGAMHVLDPTTKRVYIPAHDRDNINRVLCTYTNRMSGSAAYRFAFLTAAVPADASTVTVSLGALGTATAVPVLG